MSAPQIHIIGGGLAGLAAAVRLRQFGSAVAVYEAAPRAGGRCRSFHDLVIGGTIDNGNHLLLSGNASAMSYLAEIGATDRLTGPARTSFDFIDVQSGRRWNVRPGTGAVPWWILDARRRVPDTRVADYWSIVRLLRAGKEATVSDCIDARSTLFSRFWEPLTVAVLNTPPAQAAATLLQAMLRETVAKGADACRPLIARESLADTLIDPALATLARSGVTVRLGARVTQLEMEERWITGLIVDDQRVVLDHDAVVILAVPAWVATEMVPGLRAPSAGAPIVNVHYRLTQAASEPQIIGIIGGVAQWVFRRGEIASVTISGATAEAEMSAQDVAARCWPDVARALGLDAAVMPPARVIKERRATPAQTPAAVADRPKAITTYDNLVLAGDWTDTGLPATIEAAVRSGFTAAQIVAGRLSSRLQRGAA
jgi:squalene-associated FAD-dependent desaturase